MTSELVTSAFAFVNVAIPLLGITIGRRMISERFTGTFGCASLAFTNIDMDEEQKKYIRIDPLKVQQKIYEMYPANSAVRRNALADAKAKELQHLSDAVDNGPVQMAQSAIGKNKQLMLWALFIGGSLFTVGISAFVYAFVFSKTAVELFLSAFVGGIFLSKSFGYFYDLFYLRRVTTAFLDSLVKIQNRIKELKR